MKRQTTIILYILAVYVVLQFLWWGYHLIELTQELSGDEGKLPKRELMIIGEGLVFFLLLILGFWKIQSSIRKDLKLAERQKNFLLSVTHELKTPIAANKLFLQTIGKRELTNEQKQEIVQKALSENDRLALMIDNILNASRIENNSLQMVKEEVDLSNLLENIANRFKKFNPKQDIVQEISPLIKIQSDGFLIETVFNNLIENAIKYGGATSRIEIYLKSSNAVIILGVKDNGPGITKENSKEIFSKFFRVESEEIRSQKGSGLGLFIVAEFVRLMKGEITYKNNMPNGANFEIILKNDK